MGDAGFYKGTSSEQDSRWGDKQKKLIKSMKFPPEFTKKCTVGKVTLEVMRPWIAKRINQLLSFDDDVLVEFIYSMIEQENPDPRLMQVNLTGFLEKKTPAFVKELWGLLLSAQESESGIPAKFLEEKKEELKRKRAQEDQLKVEIQRIKDREAAEMLASTSRAEAWERQVEAQLSISSRVIERARRLSRSPRRDSGRYRPNEQRRHSPGRRDRYEQRYPDRDHRPYENRGEGHEEARRGRK